MLIRWYRVAPAPTALPRPKKLSNIYSCTVHLRWRVTELLLTGCMPYFKNFVYVLQTSTSSWTRLGHSVCGRPCFLRLCQRVYRSHPHRCTLISPQLCSDWPSPRRCWNMPWSTSSTTRCVHSGRYRVELQMWLTMLVWMTELETLVFAICLVITAAAEDGAVNCHRVCYTVK